MSLDDPELALNLEPLANHVAQIVQDLRQVAASLALSQYRRHEKSGVDERHPSCQPFKGVGQRQAEILLVVQGAELSCHRLRQLLGRHPKAGGERMTRTKRPGDEIDRLGKLLFELLEPAAAKDT